MGETAVQDAVDFRGELIRKGIHLFSLVIPAIYYFIPKILTLEMLVPITVAFIVVDLARYDVPLISTVFYKFFGFLFSSIIIYYGK